MNLLAQIRNAFEPIITQLSPDASRVRDFLGMVKPTQNVDHGDYQANMAMPLAKLMGLKPPVVAQQIIDGLPKGGLIESASVAGPGFINLKLSNIWLAEQIREMAQSPKLGVEAPTKPKTFIVDYSSPNVAKPLHVGHLRSTIIGDSLVRILQFLGHNVVTDNHLGDWGTQFGILIYGYRNLLDREAYEKDPVRELARIYVAIRNLFKKKGDEDEGPTDDPVLAACQQETAKLHAGDTENLALWTEFMPHCLEAIQQVYRRLGILKFDHIHGESFYNPMLPGVVEELLAKKLAVESQGAIVIPNAKGVIPQTKEEQQKEEPPALIRKRDGAFTYTTSDLATVKYRVDHFHPDVILYVVDSRQALHFKTFFAQARRWLGEQLDLQHISFGSVLGKGNKPLSTREGGAAELLPLLEEAEQEGRAKYVASYNDRKAMGHDVAELSEAEVKEIADAVGSGAVKYADLSQNRTSDYVFDTDKMLATTGNTSTYMQYAYARCRGIFRKGEVDTEKFRQNLPALKLDSPFERALAVQLLKFSDVVEAAGTDYLPHYITTYLWDLAKAYSGFFENCPVLQAEGETRASRLLLVDMTARVIQQSLYLVGIRTLERM
jgi:arginyl-tRNA synthetase